MTETTNPWNPFNYPPRSVAKAIWGFLAPGAGIVIGAYVTQLSGGAPVTKDTWILAAIVAFGTSVGVFGLKNQPKVFTERTMVQVNKETGAISVLGIIGLLLLIVGILSLLGVLVHLGTGISVILLIVGFLLVLVDARGMVNL